MPRDPMAMPSPIKKKQLTGDAIMSKICLLAEDLPPWIFKIDCTRGFYAIAFAWQAKRRLGVKKKQCEALALATKGMKGVQAGTLVMVITKRCCFGATSRACFSIVARSALPPPPAQSRFSYVFSRSPRRLHVSWASCVANEQRVILEWSTRSKLFYQH